MRITAIESFCTAFVGFVRVTDADGGQGWGQLSTYNSDISARVLHRQVAPWVLGQPCDDLDALLDTVAEREHKFPGSYLARAMGGFDTAVWDLRGRRAGKPVVELLGGRPGRLRAYASSMKRDITPADEAARMLRLRDERGSTPSSSGSAPRSGTTATSGRAGPRRSSRYRRALGPEVALLADANSCYSPARAIEVGRHARTTGSSISRSPVPTGSSRRQGRWPTRSTSR